MDEQTRQIIESPKFNELLAKRSRLRWGFTGLLVSTYVGYGLCGIWFTDALSRPFLGTAMSWIMAIAYTIMVMSIAMSLFYVRAVGKLHATDRRSDS